MADRQLWTLGIWTARPGRAEDLRAAWQGFAEWTAANVAGAGHAYLLQDAENADRFISFGPWASESAAAAWRDRPEFREFVAKIREICVEFQPQTLWQAGEVGGDA